LLPNAKVQLQGFYHQCGEAASAASLVNCNASLDGGRSDLDGEQQLTAHHARRSRRTLLTGCDDSMVFFRRTVSEQAGMPYRGLGPEALVWLHASDLLAR